MKSYKLWMAAVIATITVSAGALVTGSGTSGAVPLFTGPSALGNSPITVSGSNVGIGTTTPTASLAIRRDAGTGNPLSSPAAMIDFDAYYTGYDTETVKASIRSGVDGTAAWNTQSGFLALYTANAGALNEAMRVSAIGNVGIGTALPQAKLEVAAGDVTGNFQVYNALTVRPVTGTGGYGGNGSSVYMSSSSNHGIVPIAGLWSALEDGGDGGVTYSGALVLGTTTGGNAAPVESVRINRFGNMGIGTNVPGEKLEVKGNIKLRRAVAAPSYFLTETSKAWPGQDLSAVETTLSRSTHRGITRNMSQVTCWF